MGRRTRDYHRGVILLPLRYTVQPDVKACIDRATGCLGQVTETKKKNNKKKPMVILKLGTPLGRPS